VERYDYDVWGRVTFESGDHSLHPFGYAGGLYDADTGLVRFGVRDYDADAGRWTAPEPLGFAAEANWYRYANGDPVNYFDPSGRIAPLAILGLGILGGVLGNILFPDVASDDPSKQRGDTVTMCGTAGVAGALAAAAIGISGYVGGSAAGAESVALGEVAFTTDGISGAIAESATVTGENLLLENFTIQSMRGGMDLVGPMRQMVALAQANGASTITMTGTVVNEALATRLGLTVGSEFAYTVAASSPAILQLLRSLR